MTKNATKALLCGALLASVLPAIEQTVSADPGSITVHTNMTGDADNEFSLFSGVHTFGGAATVLPYASTFYSITVTSALSQRPGWQYEVTFDYINFGISFFQGASFNNSQAEIVLEIDDPNGVGSYTVKDWFGNAIAWTEYGGSGGSEDLAIYGHDLSAGVIHIFIDADDIAAGGVGFSVQWNAVPAPGALALLGVAGVIGKRRRRN